MVAVVDNPVFSKFRESFISLDPIAFCEKYLNLDGKPFRINGNGYKPFADMYRYIGVKALERTSLPVVICKGRQVGATTMAAALELYFMSCGLFGNNARPPIRIMHCFPQLDLAYAYTKSKLNALITMAVTVDQVGAKKGVRSKSFIEDKLGGVGNDSLQYKEFKGGNHIWIESTGLTGDRIRGRSVDVMFFDEVQDMRAAALGNATKILSMAQYGQVGDGIQLYFGTPKARGSEFHKIWEQSSQQYYHLGCEQCNKDFPLYQPGEGKWEEVWIEDSLPTSHPSHGFIVRCTHCGCEQDKRGAAERGKWVAYNNGQNGKAIKYIGFHLNQIYMPTFPRRKIIGEKPENHPLNTERIYKNEVLGEFFSGTSTPITSDEIDKKCGEAGRKMKRMIPPGSGRKVYLGADWGQRDDIDTGIGEKAARVQGKSYSCVVIITTDGPHLISIEYAYRLLQNDFISKKEEIEEFYRRYSVDLGVGDIGDARDLSEMLYKSLGNRFLVSRMIGTSKQRYKFVEDTLIPEIQANRESLLSEVFEMMKRGEIKFPYGDYDKIGWLVSHCSSMDLKVSVDRNNESKILYVKGGTPNDGLMALCNAILAYRFDQTNGFKNMGIGFQEQIPEENDKPMVVAGHLPKMNYFRQKIR